MDLTSPIDGSRSTASPCGRFIACIWNVKLRIFSTYAPDQHTDISIRPVKTVDTLHWSEDSSRIAIKSEKCIEVVVLADLGHRIRVDNGSGGLGDFTSVSFVGRDHLLVRWEFGKAKIWCLNDGKGLDLQDLKSTCVYPVQARPRNGEPSSQILATLSRSGSDDLLNIYAPALSKRLSSTKLPTVDAGRILWSPNGRWLAVRDTPTAAKSVHILTPDGHLFRSYPNSIESDVPSLGVKGIVWSPSSQILALKGHDGRMTLLNTRTFAPIATIEHSTTIDQRSLPQDQQAPIWQEHIAASGERSYNRMTHPQSPPLSKICPDPEPDDIGVRIAEFSSDGSYLATQDEKMLGTIWIWNMSTLVPHAVLIQHSGGRPNWHPTRPGLLEISSSRGRCSYLYDVADPTIPPTFSPYETLGRGSLEWISTPAQSKLAFIFSSRETYRVFYPEGLPEEDSADAAGGMENAADEVFDEGGSEDSLFDVLSGRKPLPPKTEVSYTERVDFEVESAESDLSTRVDDTFREKKSRKRIPVDDPFDDSEIF